MSHIFDNQKYTINGIPVPKEHYWAVHDAIEFNIMEGWHPTDDEIKEVIANAIHPDLKLKKLKIHENYKELI